MKISYQTLQKFIELPESPEMVEQMLTGCGLEVESVELYESIPGGLKGVVAGKVLTCVQHPNADRLRVTTVDIGSGEPVQIVCGAPNVAVGQTVPVATVGTSLYTFGGSQIKIEKSKIRGEISMGMICAEDELGIGSGHDGIMVLDANITAGTPASEFIELYTDYIFEIGLTANRGDAASHLGVARDLSAILKRPLLAYRKPLGVSDVPNPISFEILNPSCRRYAGVYISGVKNCESPAWLKQFLKSMGLNPISAIVDLTNYILLVYGQPLHAFDADKIQGKITVSTASEGEKFTALNKEAYTLGGAEMVIRDTKENLALAGVIGGLPSAVQTETQNIFIESAWFDAVSVRKTAKFHSISTDSSFRFERGTDPEGVIYGLEHAVDLITALCGGKPSALTDVYPAPAHPLELDFSLERMNGLIGQAVPENEVIQILEHLGFSCAQRSKGSLMLKVPTFKHDVTRQADVTEEVLRIYGLNKIEFPDQMRISQSRSTENEKQAFRKRVAAMLGGNGFSEMKNNSLVSSEKNPKPERSVLLLNPLSSELNAMRQCLLHGALQSLSYNKNRQMPDVRLFEIGRIYFKNNAATFEEKERLALVAGGHREPESFEGKPRQAGFHYVKSAVEQILKMAGIYEYKFEPVEVDGLMDVYSFQSSGRDWGYMGLSNQQSAATYDLGTPAVYAELDWDAISAAGSNYHPVYQPVPRFPSVRRDLSLLLEESVTFADIEKVVHQSERKLLQKVGLFDIYRGEKTGAHKKSYAINMWFSSPEKTLTDQEMEKVMQRISKGLSEQLGAVLR